MGLRAARLRAAFGWKAKVKLDSSAADSSAPDPDERPRAWRSEPSDLREQLGMRKAATMVEEMRRVTMTYSMALTRGSMKVYTEPCCAWRIGSRSAS